MVEMNSTSDLRNVPNEAQGDEARADEHASEDIWREDDDVLDVEHHYGHPKNSQQHEQQLRPVSIRQPVRVFLLLVIGHESGDSLHRALPPESLTSNWLQAYY